MPRHTKLSRNEVLQQLEKFSREMGRPPSVNEKGFQDIVNAARREFGSWKHALKIAGLQSYSEWKKKKTFVGKICTLLNCNPMTLKEIRKKLGLNSDYSSRIGVAIRHARNVKSIGPRKRKIYFLEGQETLAQTRLDAILFAIPKLEEDIFYLLRQPMTRNQIEERVLENTPTAYERLKIRDYLRELILAGLIYKAVFVSGRGHGRARRFKSYDLFGDLSTKTFYCRFDCPNEVAQLVLNNIPQKKLWDKNLQISRVSAQCRHLERIVPKNVFRIIDRELWKDFASW